MKRKVCILQNGLSRGGTDTFVINLIQNINRNQFDITIVNPCLDPLKNSREKEVLNLGIRVIKTADINSLRGKLRHFAALYHILKHGKFDIFQTNVDLFNGPNLFIAWLADVKVRICHSHNSLQQKELIEGRSVSVRIYQSIMRWLCWHFSNRRCGCSVDAMNFLFKGHNWRQDQYPSIINNGIDLNLYRQNIDVAQKKKELGLTAPYNILTVGRIIPQKNPLFIAQTFCELCKIRTDCDLVWVGEGSLESECKQIIDQQGCSKRVHFLGTRGDVHEIMKCCNLFYLPSAFEGLGIVLIEAQASGLPCLASDVIPHEADCGACCFIPLSKPIIFWAKQLNNMLNSKGQNLSIIESKIQLFSVKRMVMQMEQVFNL